MAELILLVVALLCLFESPSAAVFFTGIALAVVAYKRYGQQQEFDRVQRDLQDQAEDLRRQLRSTREVVDKLSLQLSEMQGAVAPQKVSEAPKPAAAVVPPYLPAAKTPTPIAKPEPVAPPPVQAPIVAPVPFKPPTPAPSPVTPVASPTLEPVMKPVEPPAAPKPEVAPVLRPTMPVAALGTTPPEAPATPKPEVSARPIAAPPKPAEPSRRPEIAASVVAPPPPAFRAVASGPTIADRLRKALDVEETLGTNWLNKLGIVILVLGVALFGMYELSALGPLGKVLLLFTVGATLLGTGLYLDRGDRYRLIGRTAIGGGWALLFFTSYGMHHVDAMRVLFTETPDLLLMLGVAVAMALHTLRYRSQAVTGMAFLLAYSTVTLTHDTVYALSAGAILAIGLVIITLRLQWYELEIFGILSSYLNHLFWLYKLLGIHGAGHHAFPEYIASTAILALYWLVFRVSYVSRKIDNPLQENISAVAALLNTILLLAVVKFQSVHPELAFYALLVLGALELGFGQVAKAKLRRHAFILLSILGATLMIMAVPFRYSGENRAILWMIGAEAFLAAGIVLRENVFRRIGNFTALGAALDILVLEVEPLFRARAATHGPLVHAGTLLLTTGFLFYLNAHWLRQRWAELFSSTLDGRLLTVQSYCGAFTLALGLWAVAPYQWTALAWAGLLIVLAFGSLRTRTIDLYQQVLILAAIVTFRTFWVNFPPLNTGVVSPHLPRVWIVGLIAAAMYLSSWPLGKARGEDWSRNLLTWFGTAILATLVVTDVPDLWMSVAWMGLGIVLLLSAHRWKLSHLCYQEHVLAALAVFCGLGYLNHDSPGSITQKIIPALIVAAALYAVSRKASLWTDQRGCWVGYLHTWAATALVVGVTWLEFRQSMLAIVWMGLALILAAIARWFKVREFSAQAHTLSALAVIQTIAVNLTSDARFHGISERLFVTSLVIAALYVMTELVPISEEYRRRDFHHVYTWCATTLAAALAWYELPPARVGVAWILLAVALAAYARWKGARQLPLQSHLLAALAAGFCAGATLTTVTKFHGLNERLPLALIIIGSLYLLSRLVPIAEEHRALELHHAYTWVASSLAAGLLWYELQPLSVALGWALFGLVLFELGTARDVRQLRLQGYVALFSSFGRIFVVNLAATALPGDWLSPRMITVVPVILILFFVYSQMAFREEAASRTGWLDVSSLLAYCGSVSIAALLYFQVSPGWIAAAWALLVPVFLLIARLLEQEVFLQQAILLTAAIFSRGVIHNLFGASYFTDAGWKGRYAELGSAIVLMLASLPLAYRLKHRFVNDKALGTFRSLLTKLCSRPEQVVFFAPVILLTFMLALKMRLGMVTVAWGIEGVAVVLLALTLNERSFRLTGLGIMLLCVGKIMLLDAWRLAPRDRYLTFIVLGIALLGVSFLYTRYREAIRQYL